MDSKTNSDDWGCLIPVVAVIGMIICLAIGSHFAKPTESIIGVTYEITVTDHDGQEIYADSGWANADLLEHKDKIILTKEDDHTIIVSGVSFEGED